MTTVLIIGWVAVIFISYKASVKALDKAGLL